MNCQEVRTELGAYVLHALQPEEAAEVWRHLSGCPRCQAEYAELQGMPTLLSLVSPEHAEIAALSGAPRPSDLGLPRLLQRVREERARQRSRQRRRRSLLAIAAALVLILAGAGGTLAGRELLGPEQSGLVVGPPPTGPAVTWEGSDAETGVSATAKLEPYSWGTRVDAVMSGMEPGAICLIRVVDNYGRSWDAGSWEVGDKTDDLRWVGDVGAQLRWVDRVEIWDGATDRRLVTLTG